MKRTPHNGSHVYEVAVYNKDVRALVKENQSHDYFEDHWADLQVRDVIAENESEAMGVAEERFPPGDGFVIERICCSEG